MCDYCISAKDIFMKRKMAFLPILLALSAPAILLTPPGLARLDVAAQWAQAMQMRDGYAQFQLYSDDMRDATYDYYAGLGWVTGTSSPWIESCTIRQQGDAVYVVFSYATSTGAAGTETIKLTFTLQSGRWRIASVT